MKAQAIHASPFCIRVVSLLRKEKRKREILIDPDEVGEAGENGD
jgi:hypothetical protein